MPTTTSSVYNQLPVPLMLQMANNWQARSDGQLISSVVATPTTANRSSGASPDRRHAGSRLGRRELSRAAGERWPQQQPAPDILVRLVGHWHAKCALQYLLCYLLSSSVTILVCLRLFRMCTWQRLRARACAYSGKSGLSPTSAPTDPASYGFYYRTRLGGYRRACDGSSWKANPRLTQNALTLSSSTVNRRLRLHASFNRLNIVGTHPTDCDRPGDRHQRGLARRKRLAALPAAPPIRLCLAPDAVYPRQGEYFCRRLFAALRSPKGRNNVASFAALGHLLVELRKLTDRAARSAPINPP